jgi:hypothetical protein
VKKNRKLRWIKTTHLILRTLSRKSKISGGVKQKFIGESKIEKSEKYTGRNGSLDWYMFNVIVVISLDFDHFLYEAEDQILFSCFSKGANYDE